MIDLKNLSRRFENGTRISYQDLTFETGQTYVLLGASGCGKSTLLNLIAGVLSPSDGSVTIDGRVMSAASQKEKDRFRIEKIGYIFQDFKLIEEMTVEDNLRILELEGIDVRAMDEILEALGLKGMRRRRVRTLSGGEKQRVAIARALIKAPDLILADEPTGSLNYAVGRSVVERLIAVSNGKTLLCVTHDDRLAALFDHTLDMNAIARGEEVDSLA